MTQGVAALVHARLGRPAIVIGGGPSAPEQLARAEEQTRKPVYLSANQHGVLLRSCDFIVALDMGVLNGKLYEGRTIFQFGSKVVSSRPGGDFRIYQQPLPNSGIVACWLAWLLGCAPVLPCGMDMYGPGGTYYHDKDAGSTGYSLARSEHEDRWRRLAGEAPGIDVRSLGGPLDAIYPPFRAGEQIIYRGPPADVLRAGVRGVKVRFKKAWRGYPKDGHEELAYGDAHRALKSGAAVLA